MDDKEQFTNLVAKHASGLTEEQLYRVRCLFPWMVNASRLHTRFSGGIVPATHWMNFWRLTISLNAIHPDEYLTDMLLKPHEVIGALADEGDQLNNATPVYFFPDTGVYAAVVSETRVLDARLCWYHATRRTGNAVVGIAPAGYEFNRSRGGKAIRVACPHPSSPLPGPNVLSGFA